MRKQLIGTLASTLLPICSAYAVPLGAYSHTRSYLSNSSTDSGKRLSHALLPINEQSAFQKPQTLQNVDSELMMLQQGNVVSELIVIDAAVPDKHLFYKQVKPGVDVVEINTSEDGLLQLEEVLKNHQNLNALHIVSHANDGVLYLGNSQVSQFSLEEQLSVLSTMDNALKDGADVLFYGCELAKTEKGEALLELITRQANVDVAASNDLTGDTFQRGDWELEIQKGDINTQPAFDSIAMTDFQAVLAYSGTLNLDNMPTGYAAKKSYTIPGYTYQINVASAAAGGSDLYNAAGGYVYAGTGSSTQTSTTIYFTGGEVFDLTGMYVHNSDNINRTVRVTSNKGGTVDSASLAQNGSETLAFSGAQWEGITTITIQYDNGATLDWLKVDNIVLANTVAPNSVPAFANLNGDSYTYTEGDSQTVIDQGTALTLTDGDGGDFNGGNLTVTITSGEDAAEDTLSLSTLGSVSLAGTTAGSNVSVGGSVVGTLGNNIAAGNDLVVNFSTINATPANIQTLARAMTYENTDTDNPTTGARNVRVTVNDGDGGTSTNQDVTITVAASNDVPTLTNLNGDSFTYSQGSGASNIDQSTAAVLADVDSLADFNGGNLTVTITSGEDAAEDQLSVDGTVTLGGLTAGSSVTAGGFIIGTLGNNVAEGNDFVVNFNANATPARVQTLIRAVTYENTDVATATTGARNVRLTVNDGDGGTSANQDVTVTVTSPDSDGNLTAAVTVIEPVNLAWSADTVGEAVNLFDFTLTDGGAADGLPMVVSQVVVNVTGTASDTDRAKVTWRLNSNAPNNDVSNVTGVYNGAANTITFTTPSLSIADGTSEVLTINGYYNDNSGLAHGDTIILSVDGDTDLTLNGSNTQMGATSAVNNSTGTVVIDDISPVVTSVGVPGNSTYTLASNLDFTVNFDETVTVNTGAGTPRLTLTVGATTRYADYISGSPGTALTFRHVVQAGDEDLNGIAIGATLDTNLGTIRDSAGNDMSITLNSVGSLANVFVDALAPAVAEVTPVSTPTIDSTPDVTFSTTEAGVLSVGGSCGSGDEGAIGSGNQTITLTQPDNSTALASGTYSNCTVTVTDAAGNASNALTLTSFVLDATDPTVDTNAGKGLNEGDTGVVIANTDLSSSDNVSAAANVTYTLVNAPANGTLRNGGGALAGGGTFTQANINAGVITYDHDGGETVSDSFTFTVTDGAGNVNNNGAANFTFNLTVAAVNDAPSTTVDADSTNEDNAVVIDVLANDSDADGTLNAASVTVTVAPNNGSTSVNGGTGAITYTPDANFEGVDTFSYTVADNNALASTNTTVTVTVNAQNDAPVAVADTVNTPVNTLIAIDVANNDTDVDSGDNPDPTTIVVVGAASNGSAVFNVGTNRVDYTPNGGFSGVDSFTYTIDDGNGATSNLATVTITVAAPNTAPTANDDSVSVDENSSVIISVLGNDSDSDGSLVASSVTIQSQPTNGTTSVNANGQITYTPNSNYEGSDSFTYRVRDNDNADSNTATVNITVNSVNQAPVANEQSVVTQPNTALSVVLTATDAEEDNLTYAVVNQPTNGVLSGSAPNLTYTPNDDYVGEDSFSFKANDGNNDSNIATINLSVLEKGNSLPIAVDDEVTVSAGEAITIQVLANDSDTDGDTLSVVSVSTPAIGSASIEGDTNIVYQSEASFTGDVTVKYGISDGKGGNATANILIRVLSSNALELPIITLPDDVTVNAVGLSTQVDLGIATAVDQNDIPIPVSLMRDDNFFTPGRHQVYWEAIDNEGNKAVATQIVNVAPRIYFSSNQTVTEGSNVSVLVQLNGDAPEYPLEVNFSLSGTATSEDHDLTVSSVVIDSGQVGQIQFAILDDGESETEEQLQFNLDPLLNTVSDAHVVTITDSNVAPKVTLNAKQNGVPSIYHTQQGGDVTIESQVTDANSADTFSYDWSNSDSALVDSDNNDSTLTFAPDSLAAGTYQVTLMVTDSGTPALTSESTLFIEVIDDLQVLTSADSDGDGIPDIDEGFSDADGDGIPNFLDNIDECHVLIEQLNSDDFLIEGDVDGCLSLGQAALGAVSGGALLDNENTQSNNIPLDTQAENVGGIFDFVVSQLPVAGQSYNIVLPQQHVIPANAIYRKFELGKGWYDFVEDTNNQVASALGSEGHCPAPDDNTAFEQGLIEGHWCVRLTIEDGGPNDNDGVANGAIVDPGGVAVLTTTNNIPNVTDDQVAIGKNETVTIEPLVNDTDADNDVLTLINASALHGSLTIDGDVINYTAPLNYLGNDVISYTIADGNGGSADGEITVSITNRIPVAVNDVASTTEDTRITINIITNDTDDDNDALLVVSAVASFGSVTINDDQTIAYTPNSGFTGQDTIEYTITDQAGGTASAVVEVEVSAKATAAPQEETPSSGSSGGSINISMLLMMLLISLAKLRYRQAGVRSKES